MHYGVSGDDGRDMTVLSLIDFILLNDRPIEELLVHDNRKM